MDNQTPVCSLGQHSQEEKTATLPLFPRSAKYGHLYQTLHEAGDAVINFMSADLYDKCVSSCKNNGFEIDEIKTAGLTSVKAEMVNAPLIDECFMNLECRFRWEREIVEGDDYVLVCLGIVCVHIDESQAGIERGRFRKNRRNGNSI